MRLAIGGLAALVLSAQPAEAAVPEFGTREGDLACAGLVDLGFKGALASKPPVAQVVVAVGLAYGFYIGRVSKLEPRATKDDIKAAVESLSLEDKNTYANACLKNAGELMKPHLQ